MDWEAFIMGKLTETLHDRALNWVAEKVGGFVNHKPIPQQSEVFVGKHYPDVVVRSNPYAFRRREQYHEVEVILIPLSRLREYKEAKYENRTVKRHLWVVVPRGTREAFDSISVIEEDDNGVDFRRIR
jgi:hypothetical protein